MSEPIQNEQKTATTARSPVELLVFQILEARYEAIKAQSFAEVERTTRRPDLTADAIFRGKVVSLYMLVQSLIEDASPELNKTLYALIYKTKTGVLYTDSLRAFFEMEKILRAKGLTRIDINKVQDRSRIWKASEGILQ